MAPRKASPTRSAGLATLLVLLVVLAIVACVYWTTRPPPASQADTSPDLITESRIIYGGAPRAMDDRATFEILRNARYLVGYSETRKDPLWAAYHLEHVSQPYSLPRPTGFHPDTRTTALVRESDYTRSGYDRGHMAPNSAIAHDYGPEAQLETFLMSNVCPQSPALNEKVWERLETDERKYADTLEEVWVIDGPVFGDLNGGSTHTLPAGEAIPRAFYKIVLDEVRGRPRVFSVIMPQEVAGTELPQQFLTSIDEIEKETHLEFLWKLDPATQHELKSRVWPMW